MKKTHLFVGLLLVAAASLVLVKSMGTVRLGAKAAPDPMAALPRIILWAWERPENLTFINPREVGVAFLDKTIYLREDRVVIRPRLQPLIVPPDTTLIAVVRIESDRVTEAAREPGQRAQIVSAIAETARAKPIAALQIDFDARASERAFYRDLLFDLRRQIPESIKLSITALASWCIGDNWIEDLPVDEAVPMLFRLGAGSRDVTEFLKSGHEFTARPSRQSLGISTDEPLSSLPSGRRVYIFNPHSWSQEEVTKTVEEVKQWQ